MRTAPVLTVTLLGTLASLSTSCGSSEKNPPTPVSTETGGSVASGGSGNAGTTPTTGGTGPAVSVCQTVTELPQQYTQCSNVPGESRCLANGDRCVCARSVWYCDNACPATPPTPDGDCSNNRGAACTYASGAACACVSNKWMCLGTSSQCPAGITTGDDCTGKVGLACDYPGSTHIACACTAGADAGAALTWTCAVSGDCPATQPVYPAACSSVALCAYDSIKCACMNGGSWICL